MNKHKQETKETDKQTNINSRFRYNRISVLV
jgi:hypothetical protein